MESHPRRTTTPPFPISPQPMASNMRPNWFARKCTRARQRAVTLVEVIMSLGVLGLVAASVMSVTFMIRSTAEQAVYQNTSLTLAQGYIEQLRSLDYESLSTAAAPSSTTRIALISASGGAVTDETGGTLSNGEWAREVVFLDETANGTRIQPLTFRFRPTLGSLEAATGGVALGVEIRIDFETTYNWGVTRVYRGTLRSVRSKVPTY